MNNSKNYKYLLRNLTSINGVGIKTSEILKKKKINTVFDLLWRLPTSYIDRSIISKVNKLQIGNISTLNLMVKKYFFPRIRNLPNKVVCEDETGQIECIFFNSREGYIRKILPLYKQVTVSGKISFYKNKYQITNPNYVSENRELIEKIHSKYKLSEGINEKQYNKIIKKVLLNLPEIPEWHDTKVIKLFNNLSWRESIFQLHNPKNIGNFNDNFYKRLAFDEIFASFLISSEIRKKVKKVKKEKKKFDEFYSKKILKNLLFSLTNDQKKSIQDINIDLRSKEKMFRLLQGDVGSGKTIVSLIAAINVVESGYQIAFMAPTEILATQHYNLGKKIFKDMVNLNILTGKMKNSDKKKVLENINNGKINIIFGTHSLFQKKLKFKKLGLIIIDEQHKFGVKQRKSMSDKGGNNCDILLMSATPIPRTLVMTVYGDMDLSVIKEKPLNRLKVHTYSKPSNKMSEIIKFVKKEINNSNQVFWVCPLIEESKKIDHESAINKFNYLKKIFSESVAIIHGSIEKDEKERILRDFLNKKYKILVSTTIIEVGIDFPNANVIIIEDANKFGLSQLHQLRGRVGRGIKQSSCILIYKKNLSENAKKRINILKSSTDGFKIAEEDMKIRGFGDILGFKQSGIKNFKIADPIHNKDLFMLAEKEIKKIEKEKKNINNYKTLLKIYDQVDIINDIV